MARIWSTFTAPNGEKYYYNLRTKESTWERPSSFYDDDERSRNKKMRLSREPEPFYAIPLVNNWFLVIDDIGGKFYYNSSTGQSSWTMEDAESAKLLSSIDQSKLVLLIAIARGLNTNIGDRVYEDVMQELESLGKHEVPEPSISEESDEEEPEGEKEEGEENKSQLVAGYSSSEEEEEETDGSDSEVEALNNLNEEDLLRDSREDDLQNKRDFFELLERQKCDPYSSWSMQAKKLTEDPVFYRITDDSSRESMFEEWCEQTIRGDPNGEEEVDEENIPDQDSEVEEGDEEDLEPLQFHYLAHIVSKSNINPTTIYQDIKDENKADFKRYKISKFVKSKKAQESFVSKLLFYYKKLDLSDRNKVFLQHLESYSKTIEKNMKQEPESVRSILKEETDLDDAYAVETKLLQMERLLGLSGDLREMAYDPKYYVLGIRDKMTELAHYLKSKLL